jgi:hypothetical protein
VRSYISAFQNVVMQIPHIQEQETMHRFEEGLHYNIRKEVRMREPESLAAMMRLAEKYDALSSNSPGPRSFQRPRPTNDFPRAGGNIVPVRDGPVPMEVDAIQRHPLTPEERDRLRQVGGCFYCRQPGHIISACPMRRRGRVMDRPANNIVMEEGDQVDSENADSQ